MASDRPLGAALRAEAAECSSPRMAVVGPSRSRHGTGPFVIDHLLALGAQVPVIVSSSLRSAAGAAATLAQRHGIEPRLAPSAGVLTSSDVDAVAICSPVERHVAELETALDAGLPVFCEKPLALVSDSRQLASIETIIHRFSRRRLLLHENVQWPFALRHFFSLHELQEAPVLESLQVELSPPRAGPAMLVDATAHANSVLWALGGRDLIPPVEVEWSDGGRHLELSFSVVRADGGVAEVRYRFSCAEEQPRHVGFVINGLRIERVIGPGYQIGYRAGPRLERAVDPLRQSVSAFLHKLRAGQATTVEPLLHNLTLQRQLFEAATDEGGCDA